MAELTPGIIDAMWGLLTLEARLAIMAACCEASPHSSIDTIPPDNIAASRSLSSASIGAVAGRGRSLEGSLQRSIVQTTSHLKVGQGADSLSREGRTMEADVELQSPVQMLSTLRSKVSAGVDDVAPASGGDPAAPPADHRWAITF